MQITSHGSRWWETLCSWNWGCCAALKRNSAIISKSLSTQPFEAIAGVPKSFHHMEHLDCLFLLYTGTVASSSTSPDLDTLRPFQRILFLNLFSNSPIPSRTLVISYILRFWTSKVSAALLRSRIPSTTYLNKLLCKQPKRAIITTAVDWSRSIAQRRTDVMK